MSPALPDAAFWRGRRVLLTGHTGFKGGWAALWLAHLGAQVTGFALPPDTNPSLFALARVDGVLNSRLGDLRNPAEVAAAVAASDPQTVLHFAAQPLVRRAIADPIETFSSNVMGAAYLLDALRAAPSVEQILVVTSDKVYDNSEAGAAFAEDAPLGGKDPYSASKAACEMVAKAYAQTYFAPRGVALVRARGGNVIGGGDYSQDRIAPDVIRAAQMRVKPILRMPHAARPWQHVLDCLSGYFLYAQAARAGVRPALNFGPDASGAVSVAQLTLRLQAALGVEAGYEHRPDLNALEMKTLSIDASLAQAELGWRNRLPGEAGIAWTADWHARVARGADPRDACLADIAAYEALACEAR